MLAAQHRLSPALPSSRSPAAPPQPVDLGGAAAAAPRLGDSAGEWDLVASDGEREDAALHSLDEGVALQSLGEDGGVPAVANAGGEGEGEGEGEEEGGGGDGKAAEEEGDFEGLESVVSKFLGGSMCSQVTCKTCGHFAKNLESFTTLSLPLPPRRYTDGPLGAVAAPTDLADCFALLEAEDAGVAWTCDPLRQAGRLQGGLPAGEPARHPAPPAVLTRGRARSGCGWRRTRGC